MKNNLKYIAAVFAALMFSQCTPKVGEKATAVATEATKTVKAIDQSWRSAVPKPATARPIELGEYSSFTLDNGLKVIVVENHKIPSVGYQLTLDNDPVLEKDQVGYTQIAGELLGAGTKNRTKAKLDEEVDFIGASFSTRSSGMYGRSLKKHSDKLLDIMSDVLYNASFPQAEFDKIIKQTLSGIESSKTDPNSMASNVANVINYGKDHPYGEVQTKQDVENIKLDQCKAYYNNYFKPNNAYLIIVGDITEADAKAQAEQYFGAWKKGTVPTANYKKSAQPSENRVAIVNKDGAVQSVIRVTYPVDLKPGADDIVKARVMNNILGGGIFSGRLMQNLREDKAYTYGARSRLSADKEIGNFSAYASVRNEVTDSSVTEFLYEMQRMIDEPVSEEDLAKVKSSMAGSFGRSLESPETMARFALSTFKYNLPKDYYATYLQRLDAVTIDDVKAMAKKYIKPQNANIVVVGSKSDIGDKLTKFDGNGQVEYFDAFGNEQKFEAVASNVTPQSIIDTYLNAVGGKAKLESVKAMEMKMSMALMGQTATVTQKVKYPNMYINETAMGPQILQKQVFDGKKVQMSGMGGSQIMTDDKTISSVKKEMKIFPQLTYDMSNVTLEGKEEVDGNKAYKLAVTSASGDKHFDYYDVNTGLLLQKVATQDANGQSTTVTTQLDEYKAYEGILMPTKMKLSGVMPMPIEATLESVTFNPTLSDDLFLIKE